MSWLVSALVSALLNWLAKFLGGLWEGLQIIWGNEKRNAEIRKEIEDAKTPEQRQAAVNDAASHLGRRERP